jgi:hypothetical protein
MTLVFLLEPSGLQLGLSTSSTAPWTLGRGFDASVEASWVWTLDNVASIVENLAVALASWTLHRDLNELSSLALSASPSCHPLVPLSLVFTISDDFVIIP